MADAPKALIDPIEGEVADPRVGQQAPFLAGVDVDRVQVAIGVIFVGIKGYPRVGIEREAGHLVQHHAVQVGEMGELAGGEIHFPEEADPPRVAESGDEAVGLVIDEAARHRT